MHAAPAISSPTHNRKFAKNSTVWLDMVWQGFGARGLVALAFWTGSLFAKQIRHAHKSYPFLEIVGKPGSGKSTLIEFLWKLVGLRDNYEGVDASQINRPATELLFSMKGSSLPIVLLDNGLGKDVDWGELNPAYNGGNPYPRYQPSFVGAVVICPKDAVGARNSIFQCIVQINLNRPAHTAITRALADSLICMPMDNVSDFGVAARRCKAQIMQIITERTPAYEQQLQALVEIKSSRISKNHAQLMALIDALALVVELSDEQRQAAHAEVVAMAKKRT